MYNEDLLKPLKGFSSLEADEQRRMVDSWISRGILNKDYWTYDQAERLYKNRQYVDTFGIEAFKANTNPESRDEEFKNYIVNNAVKNQYVEDPNLETILGMTTEGQLELLNNNKYYTQDNINKTSEAAKNTKINVGTTSTGVPMFITEDKSEETKADLLNYNNEVLQAVYDRDLQRKKNILQPHIKETEQYLKEQIASGEITIEEIKSGFDKIAENTHYGQLKDSTTFKDWDDSKTIEEYATFLTMAQGLDETTAWQTIRADIQNWTNKNMPVADWADAILLNSPIFKEYKDNNPTKLRNWKRDILTTSIAQFGKVPVAIEGIAKSFWDDNGEAKENWLNGLDAEGNPLPTWRNPKYWQGMEQYNSYDPEQINYLQQTGGVSPFVNIPKAGDELEFLNATNITNSLSQAMGQALPFIASAVVSGGLANAAKTAGSAFGKIALGTLSWGTKGLEMAAPALSMAHSEGYEAYQNTLLGLQQQTDSRIDTELKARMKDIYESEEGQKSIQNIINILNKQAKEQGNYFIDQKYVKDIAIQEYLKRLESTLKPSIEKEFKYKEKEAIEDAARITYNTTMAMHTLKNLVLDNALNRVFMSKGTRQLFTDNSLLKFKPKEYLDDAGNKVIEELSKKKKFANLLIEGAEQFTEELSDAWVNSLGENIGLNDFNDFVTKTYNPKDYVEATDNFFNHFLQGINDLPDDLFTKEALFEGWAGLISSFAPGVNPDVFSSKTPWGYDEYGNKLGFIESLNQYITNPLMGAYYEYNPQERAVKTRIETTKEALKKYSPNLDNVASLMTASSNTDIEAEQGSMMSTIDASFNELVQTALVLDNLGEDEILALNQKYKDADGLAQSILNNTISDEQKSELIDSYLHRSDNKSVNTQTEEEAWVQITENAEKFSEVRTYIHDRKIELNKHKDTKNLSDVAKQQLIYLELLNSNTESRIHSLENELDLPSSVTGTFRNSSVYGNKQEYLKRQKELEDKRQDNRTKIQKNKEELSNTKQKLKKTSKESEKKDLQDKIKHLEVEASILEQESIDLASTNAESQAFDYYINNNYGETLSENGILALSAQDRAFILNPKNIRLYSPEQQQIIRNTISNLKNKTKDPNVLEKIQDLGELASRLEDNRHSYSIILDNYDALELYTQRKLLRRNLENFKAEIESSANYLADMINNTNSDEEKINIARSWSVPALKAYLEAYPEMKPLLEHTIPLAEMHEDTKNILEQMYGKDSSKRGQLGTIITPAILSAKTTEEVMSNLEDILDSPVDPLLKQEVEKYIQAIEQVGYQRDATKVQSRKEKQEAKKKAEEQEALRIEEERIRKEEELKKAEKEAPIPTVEQYDEAPKTDITLEGEEEASSEIIKEQSKDYTDEEVEAFFKEKEDLRRTDRESYNSIPENIRYKIDELSHKALEYSMGITKDSSEEVKKADRRKTINELIESAKGTPYESIVNKHFKYYTSKSKVKEETTNLETSSITEPTEETPIITTPKIEPEIIEDNSSTSLQGSRFWRYDLTPMKYEGKQVLMQGSEEEDSMNTLFKWLESLGGNYQDIIDHELSRIMKLNPDVHMMMSNDREVWEHMFEVIEYTDKVKRIHPENKGNIISSNDKQWLVIGVVGFGNKEQQRAYYSIKDALKAERGSRPDDRFVVSEKYKTKIEHLHNGYITRALEGEEVTFRTLTELTSDPKRNPKNLGIEDLKWGIITPEGMLQINTSERLDIASPKDISGNIGNVFLLVESASGKYIPIYMKPVRYGELRDGELKTEIDSYINELSSPIYKERKEAYDKLAQRLVFNTDNDIIIGGENNNVISIKKDGIIVKTFGLNNPEFNRSEFIETVKSIDARINVNKSVLSDPYLVQKYDDAGAFLTDIAKLATSNSGFSVYSMDKDTGEPNIPSEPNPHLIRPTSDYNRKQEHSVFYLGKTYRELNGEFKQEGTDKVITDPITLEQLRLLQRIKQMTPVISKNNYDYYILNSDVNNPSACKVHSSGKIEMATKEQALKLIEQSKEKAIRESQQEALDNITVSTEEAPLTSYEEAVKPKEPKLEPESKEEVKTDINTITSDSVVQEEKTSYYVGDILKDVDYGETLDEIINEKLEKGDWEDSEGKLNSVQGLTEYLKNKGIQIFGIIDVNSWLEMVRECK